MKTNPGLKLLKEGILTSNPVVMGALGLFPIISGGTTLKRGLVLSVMMFICMPVVSVLTAAFGKLFPKWLRAAFYVVVASVILVIASIALKGIFNIPQNFLSLFIPLMSVNAIISYRAEKFAVNHSIKRSAIDAFANAAGFSIVMCLVSSVREIIGFSTLFDIPILFGKHIDGIVLPFGGFLILGFMAALLKHIIIKVTHSQINKLEEAPNE